MIVETQIESFGEVVEYFSPSSPQGLDLISRSIEMFGLKPFPMNLSLVTSVAFKKADRINHPEDCIIFMMGEGHNVLKNSSSYHAIIVEMTGRYYYKTYDLDFWRHRLPALPEGIMILNQLGIGETLDFRVKTKDVYFIANTNDVKCTYWSSLKVQDGGYPERGMFAVSYDKDTLTPLMIKRYVSLSDPGMERPEEI